MLQHKHMTYVKGFKYSTHWLPRCSKLKIAVLDTQIFKIFTFILFSFVAVIYHHVQSQFVMTFVFDYLLM